tara:strand:- start:598 stop:993 length:396 start_codon:yes stop_codon:yes gene_type:complete
MTKIIVADYDSDGVILAENFAESDEAANAIRSSMLAEGYKNAFISDIPDGSASGWRVEGGAVVFKSEIATLIETAGTMKSIRSERNRRLAETDWWASSDLTMSDEQKQYRTALRDFPAAVDLKNIVWPTKP